eukprot:scaffold5529_cov117-Cylindrotheca_fusiformis.AAC.23
MSSEGRMNTSTVAKSATKALVHVFCLALYLIPIFRPNINGGPTLDELHIMSTDNQDIHGESTLRNIFSNDYWGRPMVSEASHKSWRPLTVLSFRYLKGMYLSSELTMHRCVNIITHAAAAEVVGILATRLFPRRQNIFLLQMITKVVFILHPTHVEVTANAANRNHILAVLFSTILCDPSCPLTLVVVSLVCGFLSSETFLFQVPAAAVTLIVLQCYTARIARRNRNSSLVAVVLDYLASAIEVLPRLILMVLSVCVYLGGRYYFDTLDIPEGLIRPAENPFYHFRGEHRLRNYLYTLAVHVAKSWGHEYGFDCVPALESWKDPRLTLPLAIAAVLFLAVVLAITQPQTFLGPVAIHFAWLSTLFPVSGVLKVGTFISDRIVVASSVSVCFWVGLALHYWITQAIRDLPAKPLQVLFFGWLLVASCLKVNARALQWMDSISLLNSSLETCPNFAKAHMEMSKVYSGLYPNLRNLGKSRYHLERAREIDPDLCDVHQQFAHVAIQQSKYLEYEKELAEAVLCPFTMGGAIEMWQRYWPFALNSASSTRQRMEIQKRQDEYSRMIQKRAKEHQENEARSTGQKGAPQSV